MPRYAPSRPFPIIDPRAPAAHIEALARETDSARRKRIWRNICVDLMLGMKPEPLIAAARALRDEGIITTDAYFYLVETLTTRVFSWGTSGDPEMERIEREIAAVQRAHGLPEDQDFLMADAPPEYIALSDAWSDRQHQLLVAWLRARGHADVASLIESDYDEYDRRTTQGRIDLLKEDGTSSSSQ